MKQITLSKIPDIEKEKEAFAEYLKGVIWQFYTDGCDRVEILVGKDEDIHITQLEWPLRNALVKEQLPVYISVGNGRLMLAKL